MAFQPRDAIEAMLAGHCVMFHEMIVDSVHHTLHGEDDAARRPTRSSIVAMDKAFGNSLTRLERCQTRRAEASPEAQPAHALVETGIADRIQRHQSRSPVQQPAASAQAPASETIAVGEATDPVWFPSVLGVDQPGEDCPAAAATQISGLNGNAAANLSQTQRSAYAGNRQARRHPVRNGSATKSSTEAAN
jgi:hypothetical protein